MEEIRDAQYGTVTDLEDKSETRAADAERPLQCDVLCLKQKTNPVSQKMAHPVEPSAPRGCCRSFFPDALQPVRSKIKAQCQRQKKKTVVRFAMVRSNVLRQ